MTQEQKQLLIKDLCSRLPYETWVKYEGKEWLVTGYGHGRVSLLPSVFSSVGGPCPLMEEVRPYLRPISSMTEDEMDKLFDVLHIDKDGNDEDWIKINDALGIKFFFPTGKWVENVAEAYDYLNSIHIDYRGLIENGFALEAPANMYKNE